MGLRKFSFFVIFLGLFHVLVVKGLAGRHGADGFLLGYHHLMDDEKGKEMWLNCGLDLLVIREQVRSSSFSFPKDSFQDTNEISSETRSRSSRSMQEAINLLYPKVNRRFLDCLRKQNFPLHIFGEDSLRNWLVDYLESLLSQRPSSRRSLADQSSQPKAPVPAPAPAPGPAPAPAPTPSPAAVGAHASPPAKRRGDRPPAPPQSSHPAPRKKADPYDDLFGDHAPDDSPDAKDNSKDTPPVAPAKENNSSNQTVIVAVVLTAMGTSFFFAFLFFCCAGCRNNENYTAQSRKDDGPLLTLSDFSASQQFFGTDKVSVGASQQSIGTNEVATEQQSFDTNEVGALSLQTDTDKKDCDASLCTSSVVAATSEVLQETSDSSAETSQAPGNAVAPKPPPPPPATPPTFQKPSPPGPPPPPRTAPRPPGPPKAAFPPRKGNTGSIDVKKPSPLGPKAPPSPEFQFDASSGKTKLKPFFWDKVNARPDQPMVWDNLKAGSFQFNEEMIESLFGVAAERNRGDGKKESAFKEPSPQYVRILDPKKSQNLAISLRALNVKTEEVCEALTEGNELPSELLQLLMRMAPSTEEELKLRLHSDISQLGPAEQFLKALVDIPFAFQRMEVLLFMASLPEDLSGTAESFATLEVACQELRSSRLFLKLLEAVLKTGNRMNDGTFRGGAQAFKLDTLLKLADVRGTDGKTTLLHFVVQEIIRSEGIRAARMHRESQLSISSLNSEDLADDIPADSGDYFRNLGLKVVSGLSNELENVKKAAGFDADALTSTAGNLGERLLKTKEFLKTKMEGTEDSQFLHSLRGFVEHAETEITKLLGEEQRIRLLVKDTTDYFHGNTGKEEGLRLFVIVRDFLAILDKVCKQVSESAKTTSKNSRNRETPLNSPARDPSVNSPAPDPTVNSPARDPSVNSPARDLPTMSPARDPRQLLFPAIMDRRMDWSSSDDDDDDD